MSDTIMTDEHGRKYSFENIKTQGWLDGHECGLEAAVNWLQEQAIGMFKERRHDQAMALQVLADKMMNALRPDMRIRAANHRNEFPAIVKDDE